MSTAVSRPWELKKARHVRTIEGFASASPNLTLHHLEDSGEELRCVLQFETRTLVKPPGHKPFLVGPVIAGVRYHQEWLSRAPIPTEIVTILMPLGVFHPNVGPAGNLCLGHPGAGLTMEQILHSAWAALVFNMRIVNTIDWQAFNREAAEYVRNAPAGTFPLTRRGLLEPPTAEDLVQGGDPRTGKSGGGES
jgi:hypothetical protein